MGGLGSIDFKQKKNGSRSYQTVTFDNKLLGGGKITLKTSSSDHIDYKFQFTLIHELRSLGLRFFY